MPADTEEAREQPFDVFVSFRMRHANRKAGWIEHLDRYLQHDCGLNPYYFERTGQRTGLAFRSEARRALLSDSCKVFILCCGADMGPGGAWEDAGDGKFVGQLDNSTLAFNETQLEVLWAIERNGGYAEFRERISEKPDLDPILPIIPVIIGEPPDGKKIEYTDVVGLPFALRGLSAITQFNDTFNAGAEELKKRLQDVFRSPLPRPKKTTQSVTDAGERAKAGGPPLVVPPSPHVLLDWERGLMATAKRAPVVQGKGDLPNFMRHALVKAYIPLEGEGLSRAYVRGQNDQLERRRGEGPYADLDYVMPLTSWLSPGGPDNLVILGAPGAGKSLFLSKLAIVAARCLDDEPLETEAEKQIAATLVREVDGKKVWPVPVWLPAPECAALMADALGGLKLHDPGLAVAFGEALERKANADLDLGERLKHRPYLLLMDGLDLVPVDIRERFIAAMVDFAASEDGQLKIVAAMRAASPDEVGSDLVTEIVGGQLRGQWESVLLRPLTPAQIKNFCDQLSTLNVSPKFAQSFRAAIEDVAAKAEISNYIETPFMLMLAAFYASQSNDSPSGMTGPTLLYRFVESIFKSTVAKQQELPLRRALGQVATHLVQSQRLSVPYSEFLEVTEASAPEAERETWRTKGAEQAFETLRSGALGFVLGDDSAFDGNDPGAKFAHGLFRDWMVADHLARLCAHADWSDQFGALHIWDDLLTGAKDGEDEGAGRRRWHEPLRFALTILAMTPRAERARKEIFSELQQRLAGTENPALKEVLLSLVLSTPNELFARLTDDPEGLLAQLEDAYASIASQKTVTDREATYARLVSLMEMSRKAFPPAVDLCTSVNIGEAPQENWIYVANAPVRVRAYAAFVEEIEALAQESEEDALRFFPSYLPERVIGQALTGERGTKIRIRTPLDFLISRHSPDQWDTQRLRYSGRPIVGVTWVEAMAYCDWLTKKLEEREADIGADLGEDLRVRLPTWAEWRLIGKAIAGGGHIDKDAKYVWGPGSPGEGRDALINSRLTGLGSTSTVGTFAPQYGVYDYSSNVKTWGSLDDKPEEDLSFKHLLAPLLGGSFLSYYEDEMSLDRRVQRSELTEVSPIAGFRWIVAL